MTFIGFQVNKKERDELVQITRDMAAHGFRNPQTGQEVRFLPPGAGVGTLVKIATSEYIRYFNSLRNGVPAPKPTETEVTQVAAAAVQRSMAIRQATVRQEQQQQYLTEQVAERPVLPPGEQ
jgi:hypothetical protein